MGIETNPNLFIIESMSRSEEQAGTLEGKLLSEVLNFSGVRTEYRHVRTRPDFENALDEFEDSNMRYLHISCHGDAGNVALTLENLTYQEFSDDLQGRLQGKRLFLSACEVVNLRMARLILPASECYSIVGPSYRPHLGDSAVMWSLFYHLMFRDPESFEMKRGKVSWALRRVKKALEETFDYYKVSNGVVEQVDIMKR